MKQRMSMMVALAAVTGLATFAQAGPMTDFDLTDPVERQYGLESFQNNGGGTVYINPTVATISRDPGLTGGWNTFYGDEDESVIGLDGSTDDGFIAVNDPYITTNVWNISRTQGDPSDTDFDLNTVINAGEDKVFYMVEQAGGLDNPTFLPLDSNGNVIGNWSYTIANDSDYGLLLGNGSLLTDPAWQWVNPNEGMYGTVWTLDDFTGGTGTLTGVAGLRLLTDSSGVDLAQVGTAVAIPEPTTMSLLALGGLMALRRRGR